MIIIKDRINCCGCTACATICPNSCISMKYDEEGFLYPEIDSAKCVDCHLCEKVCPIITKTESYSEIDLCDKESFTHKVCSVTSDMPKVYAAYNADDTVRADSTSGGMFSVLANYVFDRNGWVFGVVITENQKISHYGTKNREELYKFRGSKYVQSEQLGIYKQIKEKLDSGMWVLYSGTPCQVEGLYKYLKKEYEKLITVDIFCHGVGSPKYWDKYTEFMRRKYKSTISNVKFREKTYGYNSACMAVYFKNGASSHKGHDDDLYWTAFSKYYIFRPSCYQCKFKSIKHISDFTIGDFWSSKDLPNNFKLANGCTLMIVQSTRAHSIIDELSGKVCLHVLDMEEALLINGGSMPSKLISSSPLPEKREKFIAEMNTLPIENLVKKYMPLSIKQRLKCKLKPILFKIGILDMMKRKGR